ncbi:MAG: hypothetical protein ACTSYC_00820 [Promethearchaeota archaeon]
MNTKIADHENYLLFNRQNLKSYLITLGILFGIIGLYYLSCFLFLAFFGLSIFSKFFNPFPIMGMPSYFRPFSIFQQGIDIWPFYGIFAFPSLMECLIFMVILIGFIIILKVIQKKKSNFFKILSSNKLWNSSHHCFEHDKGMESWSGVHVIVLFMERCTPDLKYFRIYQKL